MALSAATQKLPNQSRQTNTFWTWNRRRQRRQLQWSKIPTNAHLQCVDKNNVRAGFKILLITFLFLSRHISQYDQPSFYQAVTSATILLGRRLSLLFHDTVERQCFGVVWRPCTAENPDTSNGSLKWSVRSESILAGGEIRLRCRSGLPCSGGRV